MGEKKRQEASKQDWQANKQNEDEVTWKEWQRKSVQKNCKKHFKLTQISQFSVCALYFLRYIYPGNFWLPCVYA